MKYQLVLQWPASSTEEYDAMVSVEDTLIEELAGDSEIDGHDAGAGEVNIFILTDNPTRTFMAAKGILEAQDMWSSVKVAYCELGTDKYVILWPKDLRKFEIA